jgi:hypothetical protein
MENTAKRIILILFSISIPMMLLKAQNFADGYSFYLPPNDGSNQIFLPVFPAEPIQSFITIDANGHFSSGGQPMRFWGVNLTTGSCFPVKEKSPFIASRMRKMGINLVRFHHMDNGWSNNAGTIFIRGTGNTRQLDPIALDRLFFLLTEMKQNAVYANLNLHVSRTFLEGDGVLNADSIWEFGKGVTYFDPLLIDLQKEYARQLLSAVNPYTNLALSDDPVIAMIEISNENTLYGMWKEDRLKNYTNGGNLMQRHEQMLDQLWLDFLQKKYAGQTELAAAWGGSKGGSSLENQLKDGDFELGNLNTHWDLELHESARAIMKASTGDTHGGSFAAKVDVTQVTGTAWHIQFKQNGLSVHKDSSYILEFFARADRNNRNINVGFQRDQDPWTYYGGTNISLSQHWKRYRVSLTAPEHNDNHLRVTINFSNETGPVWFDDMIFSRPRATGLDKDENLDLRVIRRTDYSHRHFYHPQRMADLAEFYLGVQRSYFQKMYAFLKNDLGVKVPITGTNALVGPSDLYTQQDLDYIDDHAYWNHPSFPSVAWSSTDWFIKNESMLKSDDLGTMGDIFTGLAMQGKPYTISEYNHPFPNRYQWEMIPVLSSYASFHNADGLMFFEYNGSTNAEWEEDFVGNFFSIHRNNTLMSMSPIFAYAYRNRLITAAGEGLTANYSEEFIYHLPSQDNNGRWGKYIPYDKKVATSQTIRTVGFAADSTTLPVLSSTSNLSNTGEINWNTALGVQTINASRLQGITGALNQYKLDELDFLHLQNASGDGVINWMSLDAADLPESAFSILSLHSQLQNSNMVWDGDMTVHNQWGTSPTLIRPLQVQLHLEIDADSIHIYPLDEIGHEEDFISMYPNASGQFEIEIDQKQYMTPWFGIRSYKKATSTDNFSSSLSASISPNPTSDLLSFHFELDNAAPLMIRLLNVHGQLIKEWHYLANSNSFHLTQDIGDLPAGIYFLKATAAGKYWHGKIIKK